VRALLALLLSVPLAVLAADMVLEVVPLKHRLADELLPTLRALVAPGGTVTGLNDQLVIRTTPDNLAELERVLGALDTPLRQLRITVTQDISAQADVRSDELSVRLRAGDARAAVGGPPGGPGARLGVGGEDGRVDYRNFSTRGREDRGNTHFVTAVEGSPAFIAAGQVVPLPTQSAVLTPYGAAVQESIGYRDVGAGFYVTPRLGGDGRVTLEVAPFSERLTRGGGGTIDARGLTTTVSGRLGEWIALGGAAESFAARGGGIAYSTREQGADRYDVWVKVEVLP
jgi:type II secretory pathway component HofQ